MILQEKSWKRSDSENPEQEAVNCRARQNVQIALEKPPPRWMWKILEQEYGWTQNSELFYNPEDRTLEVMSAGKKERCQCMFIEGLVEDYNSKKYISREEWKRLVAIFGCMKKLP